MQSKHSGLYLDTSSLVFLIVNWMYSAGEYLFSRGLADFQKIFENFVELVFRSIKLIFRVLSEQYKDSILSWMQIFEKTYQKSRFWALFENFDQKIAFFGTCYLWKLV